VRVSALLVAYGTFFRIRSKSASAPETSSL
jgi:hypothetical protein